MTPPPVEYTELGDLVAAVPQLVFRGDPSGTASCPGVTLAQLEWEGPVPAVTFVGLLLPVRWSDHGRVVANGSIVFSSTWKPFVAAIRSGDLNNRTVEDAPLATLLGPLAHRAAAACASTPEPPTADPAKEAFAEWTEPMKLERPGCVAAKHGPTVEIEDSAAMLFVLSNQYATPIEASVSLGRSEGRLCIRSAGARIPEN